MQKIRTTNGQSWKHGRRDTKLVSGLPRKGGTYSDTSTTLKPIFYLATLSARREAKTRIRQRDWLKLAGEKIRREQVGSVPTFLSVRTNKVAKWKTDFKALPPSHIPTTASLLRVISSNHNT